MRCSGSKTSQVELSSHLLARPWSEWHNVALLNNDMVHWWIGVGHVTTVDLNIVCREDNSHTWDIYHCFLDHVEWIYYTWLCNTRHCYAHADHSRHYLWLMTTRRANKIAIIICKVLCNRNRCNVTVLSWKKPLVPWTRKHDHWFKKTKTVVTWVIIREVSGMASNGEWPFHLQCGFSMIKTSW